LEFLFQYRYFLCYYATEYSLQKSTMTIASFDELRSHIVATATDLPKKLAQAAHYALAHPDDIALGTAASIATAAHVQPSTLVRLAQQLGYRGFSDFQAVFRNRLKVRASTYEERLAQLESGEILHDPNAALLTGFIKAARQSLDGLVSTLDAAVFAKAVQMLAKADTIYVVARRRSYPLAAQMAYAFSQLSIKTIMLDSANHIDGDQLKMAGKNDAAILCSFAPYAAETVGYASSLVAKNVPFLAITDSALSPLAGTATHWLEVAESDFSGFRSLSASMALAMALPVAIAEHRRLHV
jgi:DNA-binding MurR/RpiR family transcriptional regulator